MSNLMIFKIQRYSKHCNVSCTQRQVGTGFNTMQSQVFHQYQNGCYQRVVISRYFTRKLTFPARFFRSKTQKYCGGFATCTPSYPHQHLHLLTLETQSSIYVKMVGAQVPQNKPCMICNNFLDSTDSTPITFIQRNWSDSSIVALI